MAIRSIIKKISSPLPVISVCTALLFILSYLIVKSLSDDASGELQFWITLIGGFGVAMLVFFLISNGYSLFLQYRRNEIGSKLTAKMVVIFFFLTVIPFSLIYFFSIQFLNKGVDSWFDVRIEQTIKDSLLLSQSALEGIKEDVISDVEKVANTLRTNRRGLPPPGELLAILNDAREIYGFSELSLYSADGRVLAFSSSSNSDRELGSFSVERANILPNAPDDKIFTELGLNETIRFDQTYTLLELG